MRNEECRQAQIRKDVAGIPNAGSYFPFPGLRFGNVFISSRNHQWIGISMPGGLTFSSVMIEKPADMNVIIGHSHFIKTAEDLYEAVAGAVPGAQFGLAFCEASGDCLVRVEGNDDALKKLAEKNALLIGAGHSFVLFLGNCYPINVLSTIRNVQEVCTIYCATANPVEVIIAASPLGRGIMGVIDGSSPKGVESPDDVRKRVDLLRRFGYKRG
ncbi:MAG: hypothetical protein MUE45_04960 [Methanoregulaceae archaeon]|nr:hypothetical protein [Methanoregulaceae archaeon]MCU0628820.1 hypothetical protein [Methanoregulaceae archaeon]